MTCGQKLTETMTPENILRNDYPVLLEGGGA